MPTLIESTETPVDWSPPLKVDVKQVNLTETLQNVLRGIAQAAKNEGKEIDVDKLPTDD
jgi:hypothetical protein